MYTNPQRYPNKKQRSQRCRYHWTSHARNRRRRELGASFFPDEGGSTGKNHTAAINGVSASQQSHSWFHGARQNTSNPPLRSAANHGHARRHRGPALLALVAGTALGVASAVVIEFAPDDSGTRGVRQPTRKVVAGTMPRV